MAGAAKKVYGIEIIEEAVVAANQNAKLNGLTNCEFIAGDVAKTVKNLKEKPDLIIVDGGINQINACKTILESLNLNIKVKF